MTRLIPGIAAVLVAGFAVMWSPDAKAGPGQGTVLTVDGISVTAAVSHSERPWQYEMVGPGQGTVLLSA